MSAADNFDLDHRLEAYFATLRPSVLRDALRRSAASWQLYAAVASSTLAMVTSASAAMIVSAGNHFAGQPAAAPPDSVQNFETPASFREVPLLNAIKMAVAKHGPRGLTPDQANVGQAPSISPGGVVPLFSSVNIIQPGEWVSIYGSNLASVTVTSNGGFPTSLGGTSVEINGKPAYLVFVSPDQINLQAPDDTAIGAVSVVVTTPTGRATSSVSLNPVAPAFTLLDTTFVCGIILRSDGSGAYGNGTYDILGPTGNSFGYPTVAAAPGDVVELYGVGFGPTNPPVPAGRVFSGAAAITDHLTLNINNVIVTPTFVGISSAGLYQINLVVPSGLGSGNVPIRATVGLMPTQNGILFPLQGSSAAGFGTATYLAGGGGGFGFVTGGGTNFGTNPGTNGIPPGGTGGGNGDGNGGTMGGGGGTGGGAGTDGVHHKKPYTPRLVFPPK